MPSTDADPGRRDLLGRSVPLWAFLLCLLLAALIVVGFGWTVRTAAIGHRNLGTVGRVALEISDYPHTVRRALEDVEGYVTGNYLDRQLRVEREAPADYSAFVPVPVAPGLPVEGLLMRADPSAMAEGWRFLTGAFTVDGDARNAALLLSPQLEVVRLWPLTETAIGDREPQPDHRKLVHGAEILPDGSLIFSFDHGMSLQRIDRCGNRLWAIPGGFHHAVSLTETGETVWAFLNESTIVEVAVDDGRIVRTVHIGDVIVNNPLVDILELRRAHANAIDTNRRNTHGAWLLERFHFNDVEALPARLADRFDAFEAGDLIVSSRSLNLLFVIDPDTAELKWWRVGATQRQHDPEWLPNGQIAVLNNRMSRDFSEIVSIDPATFERTTLFDGREADFYTRIRGKLQVLDDGTLIVTSAQQARAFEVAPDGEIAFEIVNVKPGSDTLNYVITEMKWLPPGSLDLESGKCP